MSLTRPGLWAAGLLLLLTLGTVGAVAWRAEWSGAFGPADWAAIRFTLLQALASAALSVLLAVPVARALSRRRFLGRSVLVTLLGAPFILPVVVAVMGLLAVFGRRGLVSDGLALIGLPPLDIYGYEGVVLAHVFFNLPLATRMLLQGWLSIPSERFRLAASLGAPVGRLLEWPMIRSVAPGAFLVIFLICLSSFAVALILGGGPRATTVELAIYQAVRFDFDLERAALLALVQFAICAAVAAVAFAVTVPDGLGSGLDRTVKRWDGSRWADAFWIALAALFLLLPLGVIVAGGIAGLPDLPGSLFAASVRSVCVALASTVIALVLSLALALRKGPVSSLAGVLPLAASPLVVGTGLLIVIYPLASPASAALAITALVNALMAVPFAVRIVTPAVRQAEASYGRLADAMGLTGWARLRIVLLPRLRRPLGFAGGIAAALSMGDLGVIALFAGPGEETLPLAMYRLMGAFRTDAAAGAGLVLFALSLTLFWAFDRGGRVDADA
ncbi:thiamine/thiamine pyrophosphate ABC transporter permease ThiP [Pelagovum pacificum]|uniref:Thiamine/thiamine pyrophosphate ABC transporter permease ThiP n=1 Tax=Pelagovum pacificum TaxID=2588711 RepID=A0A5C5GI57_9RHOB|nr:thiamine/thiamine pyrophosphate ABC transporter permease ThiP [Pelagovum pacificum]QQA43039.1 thiamine/thiamine pyrophosphate ABC transporter permease ThiP [Pelagovum pacificum]TNY33817.1 thiamine/thiamine pyrophosphate ABC transporter permease ThiP [Pelagovum pacificum]